MGESMDIPTLVKTANGFSDFNPMQQAALKAPLFEKSLVVAAPTASGKTVVAELAALDAVLNKKQKVVYTCPLRALASEHYTDWKKKFAPLKTKIMISIGDFDSGSKYLTNYDIILSTNEKVDSLLRHKADWLSQVGLLIVDEVHTLGSDRGPVLELVISKLRVVNPSLRVLALSATIPNADQIATWLGAELVQSNYRPVPLEEGIFFDSEIRFEKRTEAIATPEKNAVLEIAHDTFNQKNKQCLVFANSRARSEGLAEKVAPISNQKLSEREKAVLARLSARILDVLEQPTHQCRLLSNLVLQGVGFHHAGLLEKQRRLVELGFKKNFLKAICATPTLAAGVNLPAFRVLIPSLHRYDGSFGGSSRISVSEYKQMSGRAGRSAYDERGESILIAGSQLEADELMESFVRGELEPVESRLGIEPVLRTHLLAAIATHFIFDLQSLEEFFSKTFYAFQYQKTDALFAQLSRVLTELQDMGFVVANDKRFEATPLGRRVSELYLDPLSAFGLIESLRASRAFSPLTYLFLFSSCSELFPLPSVSKKKEPELLESLVQSQDELPVNVNVELYSDPHLVKKFLLAKTFEEWISEAPEQKIVDDFGIAPGILRSKLLISDWLSYAAFELCQLLELKPHLERLARLRGRLKHGVRDELLLLCEVRGIGRMRARRLWQSNVRSVTDLKKIDVVDLGRLLGEKTAAQIKQNVGQKTSHVEKETV